MQSGQVRQGTHGGEFCVWTHVAWPCASWWPRGRQHRRGVGFANLPLATVPGGLGRDVGPVLGECPVYVQRNGDHNNGGPTPRLAAPGKRDLLNFIRNHWRPVSAQDL